MNEIWEVCGFIAHTHILSFQFAKTHCSMFYILQLKRLMKSTQYIVKQIYRALTTADLQNSEQAKKKKEK